MANNHIALRKMFLDKMYRGKGISQMLMAVLMDWTKENKTNTIYLGTMSVFIAAQKFYEKNGFEKIDKSSLPPDFIANPVDTIFYKNELTV